MNKIITIVLFFLAVKTSAQGNSPLSQLGIGIRQYEQFQSSFGLNQASSSFQSPTFLNPSNPASYSSLDFTIGEVGVMYGNNQIFSQGNSARTSAFNLGNFGFGFPVGRGGIGVGLKPCAQKQYDYSFQETDLNGEKIIRRYNGDGNVSQVFIGGAYEINALSLGVNLNYNFGEIRDAEQLEFPSGGLTNIRKQEFSLIRTVDLQFGLQYNLKLGEEEEFILSGTYRTSTLSNNSSHYQTINNYSAGTIFNDGDSIFVQFHDNGLVLLDNSDSPEASEINLPFEYTAGIAYQKRKKFFWAVDYKNAAWNSFNLNGKGGLLRSQRISMGLQYVPNQYAKGQENYWKTMIYRAGINYGTTPYQINGSQLQQAGIKIGIGFPLTRYKYETERFGSYCFASFGYDRIFDASNPIYTENLFKINFAIILNDKWFIQRKFD